MIDWNRVIEHVRAGTAPAAWQVVRAKKSYFIWVAIGALVVAIGAIAGEAYLLSSNTIVGYALPADPTPQVYNLWHTLDLVAAIAIALACIVAAVRGIQQTGTLNEQMLILLPEGFVMRRGTKPKDTQAFNYPTIRTIKRQVRNSTTTLVLEMADGRAARVVLDGRFGKVKAIAQQIQNAHAQYVAALARPRPMPPQR